MNRYFVYGMHIESAIECPSLPNSDQDPEIIIRYGSVPEHLDDPIRKTVLSEVKPGHFIIKVPNIANFYIRAAKEIIVDKDPDAMMAAVRTYLLGSALAGILHQRAMFPFHASSVQINGKSILICGDSGDGKSTLAAELIGRGHSFISDDVSVITLDGNSKPILHPGYPNFRLWKKSLRLLDKSEEGLESVRKDINKFNLSVSKNIIHESTPVAALFFLDKRLKTSRTKLTEIEGSSRFNNLRSATFRKNLLSGHGKLKEHFALCIEVSNACKMYTLFRNPLENTLVELADLIENKLADE